VEGAKTTKNFSRPGLEKRGRRWWDGVVSGECGTRFGKVEMGSSRWGKLVGDAGGLDVGCGRQKTGELEEAHLLNRKRTSPVHLLQKKVWQNTNPTQGREKKTNLRGHERGRNLISKNLLGHQTNGLDEGSQKKLIGVGGKVVS